MRPVAPVAALLAPALRPLAARVSGWELDSELVLRGAFKALVILGLAYAARWALRRMSRRIVARAEGEGWEGRDTAMRNARALRAATLAQLLMHVGMIVVVIVAGLSLLDIFIDIGPLLAGAGVLGVAVSLGGQGVMKDIITGFFIVLEDQYGVGDRVRIGDVEGTVHGLTLRSTVIRGDDGSLHYLPNGAVAAVANLSRAAAPRAPAP
jgi:small conductance mechanosensitive channel